MERDDGKGHLDRNNSSCGNEKRGHQREFSNTVELSCRVVTQDPAGQGLWHGGVLGSL